MSGYICRHLLTTCSTCCFCCSSFVKNWLKSVISFTPLSAISFTTFRVSTIFHWLLVFGILRPTSWVLCQEPIVNVESLEEYFCIVRYEAWKSSPYKCIHLVWFYHRSNDSLAVSLLMGMCKNIFREQFELSEKELRALEAVCIFIVNLQTVDCFSHPPNMVYRTRRPEAYISSIQIPKIY